MYCTSKTTKILVSNYVGQKCIRECNFFNIPSLKYFSIWDKVEAVERVTNPCFLAQWTNGGVFFNFAPIHLLTLNYRTTFLINLSVDVSVTSESKI